MNTEDIIRMAREAGFTEVKVQGFEFPVSLYTASIHDIKRLLETEREECAKLCDMVEDDDLYFGSQYAAAIRERGAP